MKSHRQGFYSTPLHCIVGMFVLLSFDIAAAPDNPSLVKLDNVMRGTLLVKTQTPGQYQPAPTQETSVSIQITGPIARTRLRQRFKNPGDAWVEAIYAFPLPEKAAVDQLRLHVGERILEGQIKEKTQARMRYEQAKKQGKRSALVEQHRPNLFTTSVANIPPHGEVSVEIEYQQRLLWRDHRFSLRFPMSTTPRYQSSTHAQFSERLTLQGGWSILPGEIPNAVPIDQNPAERTLNPVSIHIELNPGFPVTSIESPFHRINTSKGDEGTITVTLADGPVPADRDFVVQWSAQADKEPRAAFFTQHTDTGNYGLLMMMPPQAPDTPPIPREIIFIIDTSGSMGGASIRQAKAALINAIEVLHALDRFNVIEFNSYTRGLYAQPQPATSASRQFAVNFVRGLNAGGGTEMRPALQAALSMPDRNDGYLQQVLFITDGAIGNEQVLLRLIHQFLRQQRLFTVAIGSAPNHYFMREAARFGRGSYTTIGHLNEVSKKMQQLFDKLEKPALTDLHIRLAGQPDVLPDPLPDLYQGEPVVAIMKLDDGDDQAEITGRIGDTPWHSTLSLKSPAQATGLAVYWAREKIRYWMRHKVRANNAEQVRQEVLKLALAAHLVSDYTSLVAIDTTPLRPADEKSHTTALAANLPAGWEGASSQSVSDDSTQIPMAQGATSSRAELLFGLMLLFIAALIHFAKPGSPVLR